MRKINLKIDEELLDFLNASIDSGEQRCEIAATKGVVDGDVIESWSLTAIPVEISDQIKVDYREECYVDALGVKIFVYPIDFVNELNQMIFEWDDNGITLRQQ